MKTYIIITFSIVNVGGAQLYVRNKVKYLEEQGYSVYVFSAMEGTALIEQLTKFNDNIITDLAYPPNVLFSYQRKKVIETIKTKCINTNNCIIESHSLLFGLWGELLARHFKGTHFVFSLEEKNEVLNIDHLAFIKFKWEQNAFAGILKTSVQSFFSDQGILIENEKSYYLPARCNNPVDNIPEPLILPKADFAICLMGRLEKEFIYPTAKSISEYVKSHQGNTYNVIVIGGGSNKK